MTLANNGQRSRNARFREMLAQGVPLATVCRTLNLTRKYGLQLATEAGIVLAEHLPAAVEHNPRRDAGHEPLPFGHPLSWGGAAEVGEFGGWGMTQEWKPGDRAMVVIDHSSGPDGVVLRVPGGHWVPFECLHPLPLPAPLTELERRVVEAAIAWVNNGLLSSPAPNLYAAVAALLAARAPKDPVAEIKAAFALIDGERDPDCRDTEEWGRLRRAVAALEAAR